MVEHFNNKYIMATREQILHDPCSFNAEELACAIKNNIVSVQDLCDLGEADFPIPFRDKVEKFLKVPAPEPISESISESIPEPKPNVEPNSSQNTLKKLLKKIRKFRNSKEGEDKISANVLNAVAEFVSVSSEYKREFLDYFKGNLNLLNQSEVLFLCNEKIISESDLESIVDEDFIEALFDGAENDPLPFNADIQPVERISTEFYFWGTPGSGKTCLMAALLNAARSGKCDAVKSLEEKKCNSAGYMSSLGSYFESKDIITLMERTHPGNINAMEFALNDGEKEHPIAFVDMPGEILEDMCNERKTPQNQENRKKQLVDLDTLLTGNNKNHKIHFFIVEYGAEDKINGKTNLPNKKLLESASAYIEDMGLFKKETDLVMIIITKADLAPEGTNFGDYLKESYPNFMGILKRICVKNHINAGKVDWRKFSIGEVVFQKYARFNCKDALMILEIIVDRTWKEKGFFAKILGN